MKKLTPMFIYFVFSICCIGPICAYSQIYTKKTNATPPSGDIKFWFSKEQLKVKAQIAITYRVPFVRCYINGIEFTENGEVIESHYKDSKQVKRIKASKKNIIIKCIPSDPEKTLQELLTISEII